MIADAPLEVLYELHPKQWEALSLLGLDPEQDNPEPVNELLYGGEGGGGKSLLVRAVAVMLATLWPGSRGVIFRRTYTELEDSHLAKIPQEIPPSVADYKSSDYELHFPNGSVVLFRHCHAESDILRYQSAEFEYLLVDEATAFSDRMLTMLRSRVRSTRVGWRPIIVYTANPGGVSHVYFLDGFVDAAPEGECFTAPEDDGGMRRCFLRARLSDNPSLNRAEYMRRLRGISDPDLRRAIADGDWHIFGDQVFSEWRDGLHVVEPFEIPEDWTRWGGQDYGYAAPACHLWAARGPSKEPGMPPRIYVYREFYRTLMTASQQALHIKQASSDGMPRAIFADPAMWARPLSGTGPTLADQFLAEGLPLRKANNARLAGVGVVHKALANHEVYPPRLQIFRNCINLIRTLPRLTRDPIHSEDVDTSKDDHAYDSLRYLLMGGSANAGGFQQAVMGEA